MNLSSIAIGNLRRRKGRSVLLGAGLAVGVAMVVAMLDITSAMKADVERKLDEYGANIVVLPRAENLLLSYGGVGVTDASYDLEELNESDVFLINEIELRRNIRAVAPKVIGALREGGRAILIVGVDFPSEFRIKNWWRLKGGDPRAPGIGPDTAVSKNDIILGSAAAEALKAKAGGEMVIGGSRYSVKGVLEENASQDDAAVFMDMKEAQGLLKKEGRVSLIEVSALCSECPIEDIVAQITAKLPHARVSPVRQAMALKMQTVKQMIRFSTAVSAVVLLIGSLIVFVSMMSSVNERTKEIGVFRAIGFRKSHIIRVILTEAFILSLASGLSGWVVGSTAGRLLAPEGMRDMSFDPVSLAVAGALALVVGMASSIYPALRASRLEPLEALRYI